jgi:hypothetical protein
MYIQGGAVNHGLKGFFFMYRPSCHIEAYVSLKSTGWSVLDPWLTIYSTKAPFFHHNGLQAAAE